MTNNLVETTAAAVRTISTPGAPNASSAGRAGKNNVVAKNVLEIPPPPIEPTPTAPVQYTQESAFGDRIKSHEISDFDTSSRGPVEAIQVQLLHKRMQRELQRCLIEERSENRVVYMEREGIDIFVEDLEENGLVQRTFMLEVKTTASAKGAIREALGQVLEYRYFNRSIIKTNGPILVVVAPYPLDRACEDYLGFLRDRHKLRLVYKQYVAGSMSFRLADCSTA